MPNDSLIRRDGFACSKLSGQPEQKASAHFCDNFISGGPRLSKHTGVEVLDFSKEPLRTLLSFRVWPALGEGKYRNPRSARLAQLEVGDAELLGIVVWWDVAIVTAHQEHYRIRGADLV